ncbi:MAG: dipeptidase PepE [Pseudomonadota bacterium]
MKLLLISASGKPYLEHCRNEIASFLSPIRELHFVTAAAFSDEPAYHGKVVEALSPLGITVHHLRWDQDPVGTLAKAKAVFVGGGNTYLLLHRLTEAKLLKPLRERVKSGMPYVGSSAGSNIAGPNLLTTNDWNVVGTTHFEGLGLVPFNINPHYLEVDPQVAAAAETRDERISQYHVVNRNPVLGVEESAILKVEGESVQIVGKGRVRLFSAGKPFKDHRTGTKIALES